MKFEYVGEGEDIGTRTFWRDVVQDTLFRKEIRRLWKLQTEGELVLHHIPDTWTCVSYMGRNKSYKV